MKSSFHQKLIDFLNKENLYFWSVKSTFIKRAESYFIFGKPESKRYGEFEKHTIFLWVINEDRDQKFVGSSTITISEKSNDDEIKRMIDDAITSASLVKNPFFEIPSQKFEYPDFSNADISIKNNPVEVCEKISEKIIRSSSSLQNVKLSTTELFVSYIEEKLTTSSKNTYKFEKTNLMLEGVFLAGRNLETESFFTIDAVFIEDLNIEKILNDQAKYAIDCIDAKPLPTGKYNVIFGLEALENFFGFFYTHSNAVSVYNKFSLLKLNEKISKNIPEPSLNIRVEPLLKGGLYSAISDQFGIPLKPFAIIENNILKNYVAQLQYSQYLNIPYTGPATNYIIEKGDISIDQLMSNENTVLLLRFSAFSPKDITGDFSSEIRLGYITKNGKRIPVKGGSVSGNIRNLIHSMKLSNNIIKIGNYIGPDGIYLEGVDIAGE
ncbi:MAG: metallopeptidase TldD-related protein [Exilispira sp.]